MNELLNQIVVSLRAIPADVKTIVERKIQLTILEIGDTLSKSIAEAVPKIIGLVLLVLGGLLLLIAASIALGEVLGKPAYGFLVIGLFFILLGIIYIKRTVNLSKSSIKQNIETQFIQLADKVSTPALPQETKPTKQ